MALTVTQIANLLFKKLKGAGTTNDARQFFEEPYLGNPAVLTTQIWMESDLVPTTAPGGTDAQVTGVVTRYIDKVLTAVAGTTNSFYHADLKDCIPFNFGDGSYNYVLKDSTSAAIAFGSGDWVVDTDAGVLTFLGTTPSNMPPKLSFYKYSGAKGLGSYNNAGGISTIALLKAITAANRTDNLPKFVEALQAWFYFDSASSATGDDVYVITPDAGTGRWLRMQNIASSNRLDVASVATLADMSSAKGFVKLTGIIATELQGITAGIDGQHLTLHNGSTQPITVKHLSASASAANRIKLPEAKDITVDADSSIEFIYDLAQAYWVQKSGSGGGAGGGALVVTGSPGTPELITDGGHLGFTGDDARQLWFVAGDGGPVSTASAQVDDGTIVGQELIIIGTSDVDYVTLSHGAILKLNGNFDLREGSAITLVWDGTSWLEISRRE